MPSTILPVQPASSRRRMIAAILSLALAGGVVGTLRPARAEQPTGDPHALVETAPITSTGDAADDVAIWVNTADATKSVIIGTDKLKGVNVYDLTGAEIQSIPEQANNVDLRTGFSLAGQPVDVVATAGDGSLRFYTVDGTTGKLTNMTAGTGAIPVSFAHGGGTISGICMYHSAVSGKFYAFVDANSGMMQQMELVENAGKIDAQLVRGPWDVSEAAISPVENCVADDETQSLYVSEQHVAIWKYDAEPDASTTDRTSVDVPAPIGHFTPDVEGLAIVPTGIGTGYLIASSQGSNAFEVYRREAANEFVREFHVLPSPAVDDCDKTDGIEAVAGNFGPNFPQGLFVCQDHQNSASPGSPAGNQNFKLASLADIVDMTPVVPVTTTTTVFPVEETTTTTTTAPANQPAASKSGYWMVGSDGRVYAFGEAKPFGNAVIAPGTEAVDLEPTPSGNGYWIVDSAGHVFAMGDARWMGNANPAGLDLGEKVTSLSSTKSGNGYWIFTSRGRVLVFGDAVAYGDTAATRLNGAVLDSIPTASGKGYYMVGSDGGIFSFGDAKFYGSMGDKRLNAPVQSLVPDGDGIGYWLVASDGGIFAFDAPFKGSMGNVKLNKPVTGMVRNGNGYLMVGEDGGIFNFSDQPFHGSLGASPPARPIVSVAALG